MSRVTIYSLDVLLSQFWTSHLILYSVQFSHSVVSDSLRPDEPQHTRPFCPSPTPRVHPNLCPLSRWCHPTISSSVVPFYIVLYWNKQNLSCSLTSFYLGIKLRIVHKYIGWTCSSPGTLKAAIYISTKMQIDDCRSFSVRRFGEKVKERACKHSTSGNVDLLQWGVCISRSPGRETWPYP